MLVPIDDPPTDVISRVLFGRSRNHLSVASWDKTLRLYHVDDANRARVLRRCSWNSPVLDCAFLQDDRKVAFGDLDKKVNVFDVETGKVVTLGSHNAPVRCVQYHNRLNVVISGGWDKRLRAFDVRIAAKRPVAEVEIYGKVHCMDLLNNTLVVGDSMKRVYIYDISRGFSGFATPETKDGVLKFQFRSIKCFPDNRGFALGSIEGRVAWEYFSKLPESVSQQYAFKCHRKKTMPDSDVAYAVNSIDFHPRYGTFVTGGADGLVCAWDGLSRKRLWRTTTLPTSVSSVSFNNTGEKLAIAVSDIYQLEGEPAARPCVLVRGINSDECKPRNYAK
ncbi:WD domain/ mitotic checkpoint protein, putative [Babesia bigemina]|uniref:WD domain/ mitotic checkpoint protein, putative n=1 Tax=Babesia bigemina TaxID=5866 RepID=A0A061D8E8_BABBI|nr:WD domain/ mitotic checkpoint protein, putative [Babesia bigemina]CDR94015.1 WD domain/ mitotic checkpoint protein, putative [Babesia bigemina]|eukprot:XP_012766201.1 WD domain/ mitotic checkpoint protein, putative [Babesia bigemina]